MEDRMLPPAVVAKLPPTETTLPAEGCPLVAAGIIASIPGELVKLPWHCASRTAEDGRASKGIRLGLRALSRAEEGVRT